jgi:thiol-disulfide isomerase/thioredoxin
MLANHLLFSLVLLGLTAEAAAPAIGEAAPGLGTDPALTVIEPAIAGRVVILNFWASWCQPCLSELPALDALHDQLEPLGGAVIAINLDRKRPPADAVIKKLCVDLPVIFDPEGAIAERYEPAGLPMTYLVDAGGTVRGITQGALNEGQLVALKEAALALMPTTPGAAGAPPL